LPNGHVLLTVGLKDGRVLSFVGEKDSQPNLEEYWLYLSRVRIATRSTETVANVAGVCVVHMTTDGTVWHRLDCQAEGEKSTFYTLRFRSNERVEMQHTR
jgi:hypothetical protein